MIKIKTMKQLADAIEQFFYERGEYEYFGSDRIRWLENLTEREDVAKKIYDALENKEFQPLESYFINEICVLNEADEDLTVATQLLETIVQIEENPIGMVTRKKQKEFEKKVKPTSANYIPCICGYFGRACKQLDKLEGANRALCTNCSLRKFK